MAAGDGHGGTVKYMNHEDMLGIYGTPSCSAYLLALFSMVIHRLSVDYSMGQRRQDPCMSGTGGGLDGVCMLITLVYIYTDR